jgi:hypothetical protein
MNLDNLKTYGNNINNITLNEVWKGNASSEMTTSLDDLKTKLTEVVSDIEKFDLILVEKENYINLCKEISDLYILKSECESNHTEKVKTTGCGNCAGFSSNIMKKEKERTELRTKIIGMLEEFGVIDAEIHSMLDLSNVDNGVVDVFFDLDELNKFSSSGSVTVYEGSIFDLYKDEGGIDYINGRIAEIVNKCSNEREIAVNVGLLLVDLCKDKNCVLDYKHSGQNSFKYMYGYGTNMYTTKNEFEYSFNEGSGINPNHVFNKKYNNIYQMHSGGDCCSMVSYLVNVATADDPTSDNPQGFHWEGVNGFKTFGEKIHMSQAQAGDVFVYEGHTGMIVRVNTDSNNDKNGKVYILESGGIRSQLAVNLYDYASIENSLEVKMNGKDTMVRDMTKVYNGEQLNHEHMQGYNPDAPENN